MRMPRVRVTVRLMLALVAVVAVGLAWVRHFSGRLPAGWDPEEFQYAVRQQVDPDGRAKVRAELLAWHIMEDDRPLLVDSALVWACVESDKDVRWALLELYRHPRDSPHWYLSDVSHGPRALEFFNQPPKNAEIYRFVDRLFYDDFFKQPSPGFHNLSSEVCTRTWLSVTGEQPTRFFPPRRNGR